MLVQIGNVAGQVFTRLEVLVNERLGRWPDAGAPDRDQCPHCSAIVPSIRPLPFEYCPFCEATLGTTDCEDRAGGHLLSPVVESLNSPDFGVLSST